MSDGKWIIKLLLRGQVRQAYSLPDLLRERLRKITSRMGLGSRGLFTLH